MVNWVGAKKTNKAYEEAERKKRSKLLKKIKEKRDKPELNLMSDALKEYKKKNRRRLRKLDSWFKGFIICR